MVGKVGNVVDAVVVDCEGTVGVVMELNREVALILFYWLFVRPICAHMQSSLYDAKGGEW